MTFVIITHVPHIFQNQKYYGYAPYIREMNIWLQYVTKVIVVAPLENENINQIHLAYHHPNITFMPIESFTIKNVKSIIVTFFKLPKIIITIFSAMQKADHIHLRCPGNLGLLGCLVQILFPSKTKTTKYAGNWDPKSKQPLTYKLQQKIVNNPFLSRNMQVLVYGEWEGSSRNIKPFFTATYFENDKIPVCPRALHSNIKMMFVGTLAAGKRPFYTIQLLQELVKNGMNITFDLYGEGNQRDFLEKFVVKNNLQTLVQFHGNQNLETITKAYQESHFVLLPSESEGWPKVLAEGMFWGCVPVATPVSCVPYLLGFGKRGILLTLNLEEDSKNIQQLITNPNEYNVRSNNGTSWSRKYTLDYFEQEIKLLLQP